MTGQHLKPSSQKLQVYETLYSLNRGFEQVLADLRRLRVFPFFRGELLREFLVMGEELRAWSNFELIETMHEREQADWANFGRMRHRWEKKYRDPDDVFIEAKERRRELKKAADKRRGKGGKGQRHD